MSLATIKKDLEYLSKHWRGRGKEKEIAAALHALERPTPAPRPAPPAPSRLGARIALRALIDNPNTSAKDKAQAAAALAMLTPRTTTSSPTSPHLPPDEKRRLDERMGLASRAARTIVKGTEQFFGRGLAASMPSPPPPPPPPGGPQRPLAPHLPPEEKRRLDERMGLTSRAARTVVKGNEQFFGRPG